MNKFKNPLIAAAVLAALGLIGSLMNSHPAILQAAGGPTVTIDPAQLPLHVTGSTTVSGAVTVAGTVAATQNGPWTVGITGPVVNPDSPGRHPYQASIPYTSNNLLTPVVPPAHRLVLQQIAASSFINAGPAPSTLEVRIQSASGPFGLDPIFLLPLTITPESNALVAPFTAYVEPGKQLALSFSGFYVGQTGVIVVSGYMIDCIIAACDALIP